MKYYDLTSNVCDTFALFQSAYFSLNTSDFVFTDSHLQIFHTTFPFTEYKRMQ